MAVCGVADYDKGEEKIVLFIKTRKSNKALSDQLAKINEHLNTKIKVGIEAIVPLNSIPRTSSGKIQKFKLKEKYNAGDYKDIEIKRINPDTTPSTIKDKSEEILQERRVIEPIPSYKKDIDLAGMVNDLPYAHAENNVHQFLPMIIKNMPQVLRTACIIAPDAGILHVDEQGREHLQTYRDLLNSAEKVLGGLRAHGYKPGDQAILQIDFSRNFLAAFWGVILGGIIPVPLPIPGTFPISEGMERITKVCSVLDRFCIITDQPAQVYESLGNVNLLDIRELLEHSPDSNHHNPKPDDIAYLQFSSGSTGDPKGVMLTHFNLIYTIDASAKCVLDVRGNDIRPTIGFGIHILRHKLSKSKDLISKDNLFTRIDKSPLGKMIRSSKLGKDILDTLLIFTGRRISAYNEMKISDIKIVNWMPYSHDMGLIGFHIAPTVGGMDQIKLEPKTFIQNPALFLRLIDK
jgi:acyl-CoA synthetase (AMP-forming)/AMP-acid ligase II